MKKFRNEWKYCCNSAEFELIKSRLNGVLELDSHVNKNGSYYVHSLYFDDYTDSCAYKTEAGLDHRYKWRIRYYDDDLETLHLEYKEKLNGCGNKRSCPISVKEFNEIMDGDISSVLWSTKYDLLKEFCVAIMMRNFSPKVIIDYERIAYVDEISNVRVTFDMNITCAYDTCEFLSGDYQSFRIQDADYHVLEVKFDYLLPGYIKSILASCSYSQTSFSKYYIGRKKLEVIGYE